MYENSGTRGHSLKIVKDRANKSIRQRLFSYRVVNKWNLLPDNVVHAPTVENFNNQLDRHWKQYIYAQKPVSIANIKESGKCDNT